RNFQMMSNIGVHDFEKLGEQRVLFNVELYVPLADSTPKQDLLHEVLDYDFIRNTIQQRVTQGHTHLQETLCDDIAKALLAHPKVRAVQVSTQKPDVYPDCDSVGVEVMRFKDSA
ncbi:MAG: dihydroneopterin aldolase, partial [Burkholderiaceae bacterium]